MASSLSYWTDFAVIAYDGSAVTARTYDTGNGFYPFRPGWASTSTYQLVGSGSMYVLSNNTYLFYGQNSQNTSYASQGGVILGDGDTAPALTDYCLSGNQITNFIASTNINGGVNSNGEVWVKAIYNISNTGSSPFTIKEIGVTRRNTSSGTIYRILLTHDILESPITIAAGESGVVVYDMKYNLNFTPS